MTEEQIYTDMAAEYLRGYNTGYEVGKADGEAVGIEKGPLRPGGAEMNKSQKTRGSIALHREMYKQRQQRNAWLRGMTQKEIVDRTNTIKKQND